MRSHPDPSSLTPVASARETFVVCDVPFELNHDQPHVAEKLRRLWQELFVSSGDPFTDDSPTIRLQWSTSCDFGHCDQGQLLSDASGLRIEKLPDGFQLDCGSAKLRVDLASSVGHGMLTESFFQMPSDAQRRFLLLAVVMLMRRHGRFALHAGGLAREGRGCLIAGRSGSGKTTLGLSLIREGWSHLSDDVVALQDVADGIEALGVNRGVSCTMQTAQMFGELLDCKDESGEKRIMPLTAATSQPVTSCRPRLILLPEIADANDSQLIRMRPIEAVNQLIQFSAGIMINQTESSRQLDVLTRLVAQSRVFRFSAGRDVFEYPERVERLIRQAAGE